MSIHFHFRPSLRMAWFCLALVSLLLLGACSPVQPSRTPGPGLDLTTCTLSTPGFDFQTTAECGTLQVFENPQTQTGRQITLNIAVVRAISRNPAPDPIFFLSGGPGQAATESYSLVSAAFQMVKQKHDIVLVDQRGTGKLSTLSCPTAEGETFEDPNDPAFTEYLTSCLASLDADPSLYTTSIAMQDLDHVRAVMGYEQINLYGVSYGTRAALTYLKMFPEHVRSIILDGVVPQDQALGTYIARDAQHALDQTFTRCAADPDCGQAFPDLQAEYTALSERLAQAPEKVSLVHPVTGSPVELSFGSAELALTIRLMSYGQESASLLPLLIHSAQAESRLDLLAAQYMLVAQDLSNTISAEMGYSVLCAEDVPFIDPALAAQANAGTFMGNSETDALFAVCRVWPRGAVPEGFKEPVRSDVPALILSGQYDPVTPPENGDSVASGLPNSLHIIAPGQGHNVAYRGCIPVLIGQFIENGSVAGLDTACVQKIVPMPFFVNFSGPHTSEQP